MSQPPDELGLIYAVAALLIAWAIGELVRPAAIDGWHWLRARAKRRFRLWLRRRETIR